MLSKYQLFVYQRGNMAAFQQLNINVTHKLPASLLQTCLLTFLANLL